MKLQVGPIVRPNNEAVVVPSYSPVYDYTRRVEAMKIRWEITGRVVNFPVATQAITSGEIRALEAAFLSNEPVCRLLGDQGEATPYVLDPGQLMQGPYLIDYTFPASDAEVYATGLAYRVSIEGVQYVGRGGLDLLEFNEELSEDQGGLTYVYVGGAVNFAERQVAFQKRSYKYTQSGSAVGLLAYPEIPPAIWPFALLQAPKIVRSDAQFKGKIDTHYRINWEYQYEWPVKLFGNPHRNNQG